VIFFPGDDSCLSHHIFQTREAALDAISSLALGSLQISAQIVSTKCKEDVSDPSSTILLNSQFHTIVSDRDSTPVQAILELIKDKRPETRLLAASCMTTLCRNGIVTDQKAAMVQRVLPALIKLLAEADPVREKAPEIMGRLVSESEEYQKAACDTDAIPTLAGFVKDPSPAISNKLRAASLSALAAVSATREESRKQVIDAKILPHVVSALGNPDATIRVAACFCLRSLSRSAKNLRTSLVDAGVAMPVFKLLSDVSPQVRSAACATLCNIVLEFSPMKKVTFFERICILPFRKDSG